MRPMNPPGDPRSYHRWSVWRPMDSLGFAENVSEKKWRDDSTDTLISNVHCALVKCECIWSSFTIFIDCIVSADYWLADYPELRRTTQPSTIRGPLGEPGFCIFCSTDGDMCPWATNSCLRAGTKCTEVSSKVLLIMKHLMILFGEFQCERYRKKWH